MKKGKINEKKVEISEKSATLFHSYLMKSVKESRFLEEIHINPVLKSYPNLLSELAKVKTKCMCCKYSHFNVIEGTLTKGYAYLLYNNIILEA